MYLILWREIELFLLSLDWDGIKTEIPAIPTDFSSEIF